MRKKIIAGNWKMNGSRAENEQLLAGLTSRVTANEQVDMIVFPAFIHLSDVANQLANSAIRYGAQDLSIHSNGAYTGQVSADMLVDLGCRYVLCGHSERREYCNETNEVVAKKVKTALAAKLIPILCVGESLDAREAGNHEKIVKEQLVVVVEQVGIDAFEQIIVAYEPVWAIGTGKSATPDIAQSMHAYCREILAGYNKELACRVPLLYGGSLKPDNASELLAMQDIDGGLIGGASLSAQAFSDIYKIALRAVQMPEEI